MRSYLSPVFIYIYPVYEHVVRRGAVIRVGRENKNRIMPSDSVAVNDSVTPGALPTKTPDTIPAKGIFASANP